MRLRNSLAFAALFVCAPLFAQRFEGEILYDVQSSRENGTLVVMISPKGLRAEFKGQSSFIVLIPRDSLNAYRLTNDDRYEEIDLGEQKRLSASLGKLEKFSAGKLGQERLLAVECQRVKLKSPKREAEVWTAATLVDSLTLAQLIDAGALVGLSPNAMDAMRKEGLAGLPLKIVSIEAGDSIRIEAKRLSRKSLKASLFALPKSRRVEADSRELK